MITISITKTIIITTPFVRDPRKRINELVLSSRGF